MISAFGVEHVGISKMSDTELRHRKRVQAGLSTAGAVVGLSALGAKGAKVGVSRYLKPAAKAVKINAKIDRGVNNALVVGGGIGGAAGLNSASISRTEGGKKPNHIHKGIDGHKVAQGAFRVVRAGEVGAHPVHYVKGAKDGVKAGAFTRKHLGGKGMSPEELEHQAVQSMARNRDRHGKGGTARLSGNIAGYRAGAKGVSLVKPSLGQHRKAVTLGAAAGSAIGIGAGTNVAIKHKIKKFDASAPGSNQHKRQVKIAVPRVGPKQRRHAALAASTGMLAGAGMAAGSNKKKLAVGLITGGSVLSGYAASDPNDYIKEKKVSKSAFGVEHGEISKLGSPKVKVQVLTGVSQNKNKTTQHAPDTIDTHYKGKSAILRRPKYQVVAHPHKFTADSPGAAGAIVSPNATAKPAFAREVHRAHQSNSKKINVNGTNMRHVSKAFDPEARRHTQLGAAAGAAGTVAAGTGLSAARSGAKAASHYHAASGNNKTMQARLLDGIKLKGAAAAAHQGNTAKTHGEMLRNVQEGNKLARRARGKAAIAVGTAAAAGAIAHHSAEGGATYKGPYQPKATYARSAKKVVGRIKRSN